ncbi:MAG: FtsH protease activity modulator HflK [Succinivibrionaceae bacterium]
MSWNEPSDNKDPWKRKNKNNSDLDFNMDNITDFLKKLFGKNDNKDPFNQNKSSNNGNGILWVSIIVILSLYVILGFYTVREAEQGVVLRLGKMNRVEQPGLHWRIPVFENVRNVDVQIVQSSKSSGSMLTKDENVVNVEMEVQYRITNPEAYLYNVRDPDESLSQATDSALRYVIGHTSMDDVLTNGREMVRQLTRELLESIIKQYNMGITVVDVNFLPARAPDEVKAAFDDAIAAQEDEQRFKREAEAYKNEVIPKAEGKAKRLKEEAEAYSRSVVARAEGDVARFEKILPQYLASPEITKRRIYLETMEKVYKSSSKVIVDVNNQNSNQLIYLPLDKIVTTNSNK